ncbi:MAG TPA: PqqD family peptide modification chaperone [Chloroflexota bacterium]|nr:PqqD family peptide modification chaperone [Chloroflexota bacterium]
MVLQKREGLKTWEVEGEAVVYDPSTGMGHILNPTALRIWMLCDGKNTRVDIEKTLTGEYPDRSEVIPNDVGVAVKTLTELGLAESV